MLAVHKGEHHECYTMDCWKDGWTNNQRLVWLALHNYLAGNFKISRPLSLLVVVVCDERCYTSYQIASLIGVICIPCHGCVYVRPDAITT